MKVIVIGNAPVEHKLGYLIDMFDVVIRINTWASGYEEYIGKKTDIISMGNPILNHKNSNCPVWLSFPAHSYGRLFNQVVDHYGDRIQNIDVNWIRMLQLKVGFSVDFPKYFTTTGITTIEIAMYIFLDRPIYTYGFGLRNNDHLGIEDYSTVNPTAIKCHNIRKDRVYYDRLLSNGLIKELQYDT